MVNKSIKIKKSKPVKTLKNKKSKKIYLTGKKVEIYYSNNLQKKGWVSIMDGYIYIARDLGRSYWVLKNIEPNKRPIIHFSDKNKTIRIGNNKIIIMNQKDYELAKQYLHKYSKN